MKGELEIKALQETVEIGVRQLDIRDAEIKRLKKEINALHARMGMVKVRNTEMADNLGKCIKRGHRLEQGLQAARDVLRRSKEDHQYALDEGLLEASDGASQWIEVWAKARAAADEILQEGDDG